SSHHGQRPRRLSRGARVPRRKGGDMTRLAALAERLEEPLLVTNLTNVQYLTGFESSNAALYVQPSGETTLYTDFRYIETAREIPDVEVQMTKRAVMSDLGEWLSGRVQFEANVLPYLEWQRLDASGAELVPTQGIVEELRAVKDEEEVAKLRKAARIADRALEALTAETWVGRTEHEVAWRLLELCHAHGAVDGYNSDCTRTFSTGELPGRLREIYDVCLDAQKKAVAGIKAGMTGIDADALARDPIEAAGYGANFGHGLGHGVGLAVHEAPRLSTESPDTLVAGHAVTIEPGIYLPGEGGVRIEDLAIVRDDGVELLTSFPKELIEVG